MKSVFLCLLAFVSIIAQAQTKGSFDVLDLGSFKLHVYNTNDALGDVSYIIESKTGLVTLEQPLFKDNVSEFDTYVVSLRNAIASMPTGKIEEIPMGSTQNWNGIKLVFQKGASTDFPAASIIIGNKVYYTHWSPTKAHISHLQISSSSAIDAEIREAENALNSDCEIFIGGHGNVSNRECVIFKINYLKTLKSLLSKDKKTFIETLKKIYPNLPGETGLADLANSLYQ